MSIIRFENVDVVFSKDPREALKLLDQDLPGFLDTYLKLGPEGVSAPLEGSRSQLAGYIPLLAGQAAKGLFSVTSR